MDDPIGFIGVGAMGAAIASRLVGNHALFVADQNPAAADPLVARGARLMTAQDVAASCRLLFVCVPGPVEVTQLFLGAEGVAGLLQAGTIVIDHTSSTPATDEAIVRALAARGAHYVDAPIAGGVRRAYDGSALLMVGAPSEVFARIEPILTEITGKIVHTGDVGTGHAMKLVNNLLNACNRFAALECIRLAERAGLARHVVLDVLNNGSGRNYATEVTYPQLLSGPGYLLQQFSLGLMAKDVGLAVQLAADLDHEIPIGSVAAALTARAVERFGTRADQSQMMAEWYLDDEEER